MFLEAEQAANQARFFKALAEAREQFHTFGAIEDSNAKLDELVKLTALVLCANNGLIGDIETRDAARDAFETIKNRPEFHLDAGGSIFEPNSHLRIAEEREALFKLYLDASREIAASASDPASFGYDLLNEAFGHFVRENFRSNTEDAQYMTPPEVTNFMVELANHYVEQRPASATPLIVADPSCGVASFLTEFEKSRLARDGARPLLIGQDKVRRMLRIAHMSAKCAGIDNLHLGLGNSLEDGAWISKYDGTVDLILTNPPFGARFETAWLAQHSKASLPFFASTRNIRKPIDSEFLFIERYMTLLKDGGLLLVVVPDGVIGGAGVAALTRQYLSQKCEVLGIYHLPPVTFAQAGTRTKTAILVLRKTQTNSSNFIGADIDDLGFEVIRRKGAAFKKVEGANQLTAALETATSISSRGAVRTLSTAPLMVAGTIDFSRLADWDVKQFSLSTQDEDEAFDYVTLSDAADFVGSARKTQRYMEGSRYISILHAVSEGVWDYPSIKNYQPITPGTPAEAGEVVISKINPRIPRIAIVPDLGAPTIVSTEFEILRAKSGFTASGLCLLLRDPHAQQQLESMASGTSASHNRIKPEKLRNVRLRVPKDRKAFNAAAQSYAEALKLIDTGLQQLQRDLVPRPAVVSS